jgi:hypothetical protein
MKQNSSLWALIAEIIDIQTETRAKRDEGRAKIYYRTEEEAEDEDLDEL